MPYRPLFCLVGRGRDGIVGMEQKVQMMVTTGPQERLEEGKKKSQSEEDLLGGPGGRGLNRY